jgi:ParB/RepB/Spo0J family partition protein
MAKRTSASALQPSSHKVQEINIDDIKVGTRLRSLNPAKVEEQIESIARQGFTDPIEVRIATKWGNTDEKEIVLVAGRHRLEAMKKMGATTIPSFVLPDDRRKAEMREISENLHRAPLTPLEEAEHIANWVELASEEDEIKGHNVPKSGRGRPKGVIAKAAGTLPVKAKTELAAQKAVRRAIDIAEISPEAKEMAIKHGLDQKTALLKIAARKTEKDQLQKVRELVSGRKGQSSKRASALSASDKKIYERLISTWKKHIGSLFAKASTKVREKFLAEIRRASSVGQGNPAKESTTKKGA